MDLTGFYYAIAGCSATIIAIIGGFIVTKLIDINIDRDNTIKKIRRIEEALKRKEEKSRIIEQSLNEEDALDFIKDNIVRLLDEAYFQSVYKPEELTNLEASELAKYWERASEISHEISNIYMENETLEVNSDGIPIQFALSVDEGFDYTISQLICDEIEKQRHLKNGKVLVTSDIIPDSNTSWYLENSRELSDLNSEIKELKFEVSFYERKKPELRKPAGMKLGLFIFIISILAGVIYPFACALLNIYNKISERELAISVLVLFVIEVVAIILYLISFLKWNDEAS